VQTLIRLIRDRRGAAAVEFSIACTILFTLILGIYNLGWGLYCGSDVRHGIERAGRLYLADPNATDSAYRTRVGTYLEVAHLSDVGTTITRTTIGTSPVVRITYTYNYGLQVPFVPTQTLRFGSSIIVPLGT